MPEFETDNLYNQIVIAGTNYSDSLPRLLRVNPKNGGLLTLPPIISATLSSKQYFYIFTNLRYSRSSNKKTCKWFKYF